MPESEKIYEADIIDTTVMGAGVARIDGAATFVRGGVEGDRCAFRITEKKKNYFLAEAEKIIKYSDNRIDNDCPYYSRCGGCSLRHISYEHEGEIKAAAVRTALEKAGVRDFKMNPIKMPSPDGYRNKAVFHFDDHGGVGFHAESTREVIPLRSSPCRVVPEEFCRIARFCAELFRDDAPDSVTARKSTSGKLAVAFDLGGKGRKMPDQSTAEQIMSAFPAVTGVFARSDGRQEYALIKGERHIINEICSMRYLVSPDAFFQVNYEGAEMMFSEIASFAGDGEIRNIFDLFCGTGTIGIFLASRHPEASITGIEINSQAVENAKMNAALNLTENASFRCGDASEYAALCGDRSPDLTVIDPPRAGCSDRTLSALLTVLPKRIIYVSCNPFTLARDVKRLESGGYKLIEATPINMFPRSEHVETVVLLQHGDDWGVNYENYGISH